MRARRKPAASDKATRNSSAQKRRKTIRVRVAASGSSPRGERVPRQAKNQAQRPKRFLVTGIQAGAILGTGLGTRYLRASVRSASREVKASDSENPRPSSRETAKP